MDNKKIKILVSLVTISLFGHLFPNIIPASEKPIVLQDHPTANRNSYVVPYGRERLLTFLEPVIKEDKVQIPFRWEKAPVLLNNLKIIGYVRGANLVEGAAIVKFFHYDEDGGMYNSGYGYKKAKQKFMLRMKHELHGKARIALFAVDKNDMKPQKVGKEENYQSLSNVVFVNFIF
jgi:hypothetical protein